MADFRKPFRAPPLKRRPSNVLRFKHITRKPSRSKVGRWWSWAALIASPLLGIGAAWLWHSPPASAESLAMFLKREPLAEQYSVAFSECSGSVRIDCVVDGDTFWLHGTKIRIADINTPEVSEPQCSGEARLGARSTQRLITLLNAGSFGLAAVDRDEDVYGRKLRIVTRAGESIGDTLVSEGLAERWTGSRRSWC